MKRKKQKITRRKFIKKAVITIPTTSALADMRFEEYNLVASITRESFYEFVKEFWDTIVPENFIDNWHIKYLCDEFQEVAERVFKGESKEYDLVVNVSPGETKSTIFSVMSLPWIWTKMPSARFIGGSYAYDLSLDLSRRSRAVIKSEKYHRAFPNIELSKDQDAKGYYANTQGGSRQACSVGSNITGFHGHFFVVDDPLDPEAALSEKELETANIWMVETVPQRRVSQDLTPTILIMQRLHENDCTNNMIEGARSARRLAIQRGDKDIGLKIKHICIPAEVTDRVKPKLLKRFYKNGLMDPARLPRSVLNEKQSKGEYMYAGQYLQTPAPRGGGMFKTDKIKIVDPEDVPKVRKWLKRVRFWDKAGTLGGKGAFSVGILMGKDREGHFWILDDIRFRLDSSAREKKIKRTAEENGKEIIVKVEQEPGSGGKESAENTVRMLAGWIVRIDKPSGSNSSKELRADPFSVQVNSGNVSMVRADWNREYINELKHFPASTFKDQVDASSGAFNELNKKRSIVGPVFGRYR